MSEEGRKNKRTFVIATAIILVFVMAPFAYGYGVYDALTCLQIGIPSLSVRQDGFDFYLTLSIPVKNPSRFSLPSLDAIVDIKLNTLIFLLILNQAKSGNTDHHDREHLQEMELKNTAWILTISINRQSQLTHQSDLS